MLAKVGADRLNPRLVVVFTSTVVLHALLAYLLFDQTHNVYGLNGSEQPLLEMVSVTEATPNEIFHSRAPHLFNLPIESIPIPSISIEGQAPLATDLHVVAATVSRERIATMLDLESRSLSNRVQSDPERAPTALMQRTRRFGQIDAYDQDSSRVWQSSHCYTKLGGRTQTRGSDATGGTTGIPLGGMNISKCVFSIGTSRHEIPLRPSDIAREH